MSDGEQWDPTDSDAVELEDESGRTGVMGFLDHLEDLRLTLFKCIGAFFAGAVVVAVFLPQVAGILNWPLRFALGNDPFVEQGLVTTSPFGVFAVVMQLVFFGGFALALPLILYFMARFLAPGLTPRELAVLRPACLAIFGLFIVGVLFSFFVLTPATLMASRHFNELFEFRLLWSADRYYGMLTWMTIGIGLVFEFPLAVLLLVYVGILSSDKLRAFRPYSIVVFLAIAAIVTPTTDPLTFLLLAIPMSILYEVSVRLSVRVEAHKAVAALD